VAAVQKEEKTEVVQKEFSVSHKSKSQKSNCVSQKNISIGNKTIKSKSALTNKVDESEKRSPVKSAGQPSVKEEQLLKPEIMRRSSMKSVGKQSAKRSRNHQLIENMEDIDRSDLQYRSLRRKTSHSKLSMGDHQNVLKSQPATTGELALKNDCSKMTQNTGSKTTLDDINRSKHMDSSLTFKSVSPMTLAEVHALNRIQNRISELRKIDALKLGLTEMFDFDPEEIAAEIMGSRSQIEETNLRSWSGIEGWDINFECVLQVMRASCESTANSNRDDDDEIAVSKGEFVSFLQPKMKALQDDF